MPDWWPKSNSRPRKINAKPQEIKEEPDKAWFLRGPSRREMRNIVRYRNWKETGRYGN